MGSVKIISNDIPNIKSTSSDDIKVRVFGLKRFFVWIRNTGDEQVTAYVNYSMKFGELGAKSNINPIPVKAHSFTFIFWDCQPMPLYLTNITVEVGDKQFVKNGFTILGLNFFFLR